MQIEKTELELFNQLMSLANWDESVQALTTVDGSDAFYFQDFPVDDEENTVLRIFNYRMAGYELFCLPGALECRGIMFEVDPAHDAPLRLLSRPMKKFFNYRESPFTIYPKDFNIVDAIEITAVKEDGSLMSTYTCPIDGTLKLKSRGSIKSDQSNAANDWLTDFEHEEFGKQRQGLYDELAMLDAAGWTVNLEWCSPIHRIVLPYECGQLRILNIRHRTTGEYMDLEIGEGVGPYIRAHSVQEHYGLVDDMATNLLDGSVIDFDYEFDNVLRKMTGIEGFIFKLSHAPEGNELWFKGKTDWYCSLHHSKDSITNPRRLFECVMDDGTDDLRQMFDTDPIALKMIQEAEEKYHGIFNHMVGNVERFYEANKDLDRKDFAIKGQAELDKKIGEFGLAMMLYSGQTPDYKKHLKGKWKALGLKDEKVTTEEE